MRSYIVHMGTACSLSLAHRSMAGALSQRLGFAGKGWSHSISGSAQGAHIKQRLPVKKKISKTSAAHHTELCWDDTLVQDDSNQSSSDRSTWSFDVSRQTGECLGIAMLLRWSSCSAFALCRRHQDGLCRKVVHAGHTGNTEIALSLLQRSVARYMSSNKSEPVIATHACMRNHAAACHA